MRVIYGLTNLKPLNKRPAVALGVFDGLHRGHRKIITRLLKEAKKLHAKSFVVTFFPHPQKENSLYSLNHRLNLLDELGVDLCLVIRFTPALRRVTAAGFLEGILIKKINPAVVLIGRNFTFGRHAHGGWKMLEGYSQTAKFKLIIIDVLRRNNKPISSSWIRGLIKAGKFRQAHALLGRPVTIFGRVSRGYRFARKLGYPTANIFPEHEIFPPSGVYAVRVRWSNKIFAGICYIGNRPTINASNKISIEVHVFDFKANLYRRNVQIEFIKKIRPQKKFSSVQALASQIKRDIRLCPAAPVK
ncbi:MAG: bifunctional riboflavin kinase/FAD synthetase [Candidatus Omnitrophota bacterium]